MNIFIAFLEGLLTFFTPCVFPLIPLYISYITGFSIEELSQRDTKRLLYKSITGSLHFILGFSIIFILLGFSASYAGSLVFDFQNYLRVIGGAVIVFFGLSMTGLLSIAPLNIEKRISIKNKPVGFVGALLLGMTFAAGWVPCVGPILSSILIVASTSDTRFYGGLLLFAYCVGLGLPIFLSAIAFDYFLTVYKNTVKYLRAISVISGTILMIIGLLLMTDNLMSISSYITYFFGAKVIQ
jgi:cytochrome c-type biogenesis protein